MYVMDKEELIELLDGRSGAWLGRQLGYKRPKQSVYHWTSGRRKIPQERAKRIREILEDEVFRVPCNGGLPG